MHLIVKVLLIITTLWMAGLVDTEESSKLSVADEKPAHHPTVPKLPRRGRLQSNLTRQNRRRYLKGPRRGLMTSENYNRQVQVMKNTTTLPENKKTQVKSEKFTIDDVPVLLYRGPNRPREVYQPPQIQSQNADSNRPSYKRSETQNSNTNPRSHTERGFPNTSSSPAPHGHNFYGTQSSESKYPTESIQQTEANRISDTKKLRQGLDRRIYGDISTLQEPKSYSHKGNEENSEIKPFRRHSYRNDYFNMDSTPKPNYEIHPGGFYEDNIDDGGMSSSYTTNSSPNLYPASDWQLNFKRSSKSSPGNSENPTYYDNAQSHSNSHNLRNCSENTPPKHDERFEVVENDADDYDDNNRFTVQKSKRENSYVGPYDGISHYGDQYDYENYEINSKNGRFDRPMRKSEAETGKQDSPTSYQNTYGRTNRGRNIHPSVGYNNHNGNHYRRQNKQHFPATSISPSKWNNGRNQHRMTENPTSATTSELSPSEYGANNSRNPSQRFINRHSKYVQNFENPYATTAAIENTYANVELRRINPPSRSKSLQISESANDRRYEIPSDQFSDATEENRPTKLYPAPYYDDDYRA